MIDGYSSVEEAAKIRYRPIFLAFQQALRAWPGGASDAFRVLDWVPQVALNQLNPDYYEGVPSLYRFLRLMEYMRPRRVAHEVAALANCLTVPIPADRKAYPSHAAAAEDLGAALRKVLYELDALAGAPTSAQRAEYRADLARLMDACHAMMMRLHG